MTAATTASTYAEDVTRRAELISEARTLRKVNADLLAALKDMVTGCEMQGIKLAGHNAAIAAIAAAEGN